MSSADSAGGVSGFWQTVFIFAGIFVSVFGWFLGIKFIPPKDADETNKRLLAAVTSSATLGVVAVVYIHSKYIEIFQYFESTAVVFGFKPIVGDAYIYLLCLSLAGLCGWWFISGFMAAMSRYGFAFSKQVTNKALDKIDDVLGVDHGKPNKD